MGPRAQRISGLVETTVGNPRLQEHSTERLEAGARQYGDWEDGRDWAREAQEEAIDGVHYCARAMLGREGEYRARHLRALRMFAAAWEELQGAETCQL